jgi:2-polyprenyl-3-methyl-5-hydroxy-6-metoxy-1,4-benzoquinol methylase
MKMQRECGICGNQSFRILKKQSAFLGMDGQRCGVIQCGHCGIITRFPSLFEWADIQKLAPAGLQYNQQFTGEAIPAAYYAARLDAVTAQVKGRQLLDVGFGTGAFLQLAKQKGWQVTGTEFTQAAVEKMNKEGIAAYHGGLDNSALTGRQFDLIQFNHVLEHVERPVHILQQAWALLAPGGMILAEVPNELEGLAQLVKRVLGTSGAGATSFFEHEWFFSPASLRATIRQAGLQPAKVFTTAAAAAGTNVVLRWLHKAAAATGRGANIVAYIQKNN